MAAPLAALNPELPPASPGQVLRGFIDAFDSVQEQLRKGSAQAVVPLTKIILLGTDGVAILKKHLEDSTNARFDFSVNASADSVTLMPTGRMPPKPSLTARSLKVSVETAPKTANLKVPRPPNAFIIYRKEWHSRVVAENPSVHNNAISVIIGEKWKAEPEHVRAVYKQKSEDAKTQHAINNPGYQYQPRKPSEKKKRMTKNKMAKLAARSEQNGNIIGDLAQQPLPDEFDPVSMLDEHLASCANAQPLNINNFGQIPTHNAPALHTTTEAEFVCFDAGADIESALRSSLEAFNDEFNRMNPMASVAAAGQQALPAYSTAICAQPMVNGKRYDYTKTQMDLPGVGFYDQQAAATLPTTSANTAYSPPVQRIKAKAPTQNMGYYPYAEVERHDRLEVEFEDWIDMDVYASSPAPAQPAVAGGADPLEDANLIRMPNVLGEDDLPIEWPRDFDFEFLGDFHST